MVDVNTIKGRLRINHDLLDDQLNADIEAAKMELSRVGIRTAAIDSSNNPLIDKAVIAYCMWVESSNEKMANGYHAQWEQWRDEIRKSPGYKEVQ